MEKRQKKLRWLARRAVMILAAAALVLLSGCEALTNPDDPAADFRFEKYGEGYQIAKYTGDYPEITVPSEYNELPVVRIGEEAFAGSDLTTVVIPSTVTEIGYGAFRDVYSLERVTIEGKAVIEDRAFAGCWGMLQLKLGQTVSIGFEAFEGCRDLRSVFLPEGLLTIGDSAFINCYDLESVYFPDSLESIGSSAFAFCNLKAVELGSGPVTVGDNAFENCYEISRLDLGGATHIGDAAIKSAGVNRLVIPDSVVSLGYEALAYAECTSLVIGSGLEEASGAFGFLRNLATIELSPENSALRLEDGVLFTADGSELLLYPAASDAGYYAVPEGVRSIGAGAFTHAGSLRVISFPEGLETIGHSAFFACDAVEELTFPGSLKKIDVNAFSNCFALSRAELPEGLKEIGDYAFALDKALAEINLPDSLRILGTECFAGVRFESVHLGAGLSEIGDGAFSGAPIASVTLSPENDDFCVVEGVLCSADGKELVYYPRERAEASYVLPDTIESIAPRAFMFCDNLTSVTLPEGLVSIGDRAFAYCRGLEGIVVPEGTQTLGESAFEFCGALRSAQLPDSVTAIGRSCFGYCSALSQVSIPAGVAELPYGVFIYCESLEEITIPEGLKTMDSGVFCGCTVTVTAPHEADYYGYRAEEGVSWVVEQ